MTVVAGVLLDQVDQDPAQVVAGVTGRSGRYDGSATRGALGMRERLVDDPVGGWRPSRRAAPAAARACPRAAECHSQSPSASQSTDAHGSGAGLPAKTWLNHQSSTYARCLSRPPSVIVEGSRRWSSCAASSPSVFMPQRLAVVVEEADQGLGLGSGVERFGSGHADEPYWSDESLSSRVTAPGDPDGQRQQHERPEREQRASAACSTGWSGPRCSSVTSWSNGVSPCAGSGGPSAARRSP